MHYPDILSIRPPPETVAYDDQFTMQYALTIGAGGAPEDLHLVYEKELAAIPTMASMMARAMGPFISEGGIDYSRIVHGEQRTTIHVPLPPSGELLSQARCLGVVDKGREKGALLNIESTLSDAATGENHVTATSTLFCRADGGCGAPADRELTLPAIPDRPPDIVHHIATLPQQAALYRLMGDRNPLHIDPEVARKVGFERPILHGLCTYGIACRAIMAACADNDPTAIRQIDVRFAAPVYPGDAIETAIWRNGDELSFECRVAERGATVIRNGFARLAPRSAAS